MYVHVPEFCAFFFQLILLSYQGRQNLNLFPFFSWSYMYPIFLFETVQECHFTIIKKEIAGSLKTTKAN